MPEEKTIAQLQNDVEIVVMDLDYNCPVGYRVMNLKVLNLPVTLDGKYIVGLSRALHNLADKLVT